MAARHCASVGLEAIELASSLTESATRFGDLSAGLKDAW
jgi:hypothetical protein